MFFFAISPTVLRSILRFDLILVNYDLAFILWVKFQSIFVQFAIFFIIWLSTFAHMRMHNFIKLNIYMSKYSLYLKYMLRNNWIFCIFSVKFLKPIISYMFFLNFIWYSDHGPSILTTNQATQPQENVSFCILL